MSAKHDLIFYKTLDYQIKNIHKEFSDRENFLDQSDLIPIAQLLFQDTKDLHYFTFCLDTEDIRSLLGSIANSHHFEHIAKDLAEYRD